MRTWRYNEQDEGTKDLTDADILAAYYPYWSSEMRRQGKDALISEENCIQDFVVVYWAWEVTVG